jgi:PAS domain S-box-containing protein
VAANNAATPFQNASLITELRRVQEALRESERELRKAREELESKVAERTAELRRSAQELERSEFYLAEGQRLGRIGSWALNPSGFFEYWSRELFRIYGLDPQQGAPTIAQYLATIHPQDRDLMVETIKRMYEQGSGCDVKKRIIRPDGAVRYVRCVGIPVLDNGVLKEFLGTAMDVTEQEQLTQELQRSEQELRDVIDTIPALVWSALPDGSNIYVNKRFVEYTGSSAEQTAGSGWQALVHPDDLERHAAKWMEAVATGKPHESEVRSRRSDGQYRWQLDRGLPLRDEDGNIVKWYGVTTDIEDRKRGEADLAEAQRLSQTGSWAWSPDQDIRYWSEECYRVLSFDPQDGLPRFEEFFQRIHPDDQPGFRDLIQAAIREKAEWEADYRIVHLDGAVRDIHVVAHPVLSTSGHLVEFVGTVIDVTERRRAEQERARLRQLEADLAHINRVSVMGEMAASLAHEVKQPIASARNNARAALNFLNRIPPDLGEVREAVGCIVGDADRAANIFDRIRDHIKKTPPRKDRFDLNTAIKEVLELAQSAITQYGVSVEARLTESLLPVLGDRVQLQQVVLNLVLNSIEAMRSVESGPRKLSISTEQDRTGVLVAIRDSGPGIDPTHLERVFEAFYTTKSGGVGMGLSICRSIIDAHGGRLWAEANEPRGAIFRFRMPNAEKGLPNFRQPSPQAGEPREDLRH